jgi:hypothetical protein
VASFSSSTVMMPRFLARLISFLSDASLRSISGASAPSCLLSSLPVPFVVFAIPTPC